MKFIAASVLGLGLGFLAASASQAMPINPLAGGRAAGGEIIQVAQGCGPGFHRGPYGACRPLYSCPRGWHPGPYGKQCFPNRRW